jgi:threonine aldolase
MIDLRSDTVTQPTADMRRAIANAPVGDDVYHDDPTVLELEARVGELLGVEDAVYMPTGMMTNQVALRTHTEPGDIVLASEKAHINRYEVGAANAVSGLTIRELPSTRGVFTAEAVRSAVPTPPPGMPPTVFQPVTLLAVENSHNGAGGAVWSLDEVEAATSTAGDLGLATHLDGARLWNASVATGVAERDYAANFDTISVCFSKGLGAPMGSALGGRRDLLERARRFKQMFGGGFRQAGMMAAGALYALGHHRERLAEDHANAARCAAGLAEIRGIDVDPASVVTNMVYFRTTSKSAAAFSAACMAEGVQLLPMGPDTIRIVFHLGVDEADVDRILAVMAKAAAPG